MLVSLLQATDLFNDFVILVRLQRPGSVFTYFRPRLCCVRFQQNKFTENPGHSANMQNKMLLCNTHEAKFIMEKKQVFTDLQNTELVITYSLGHIPSINLSSL